MSIGTAVMDGYPQRLAEITDMSSNVSRAAHSELVSQVFPAHGRPRAQSVYVALPKLQIAVFNGEIQEWQGFWECYEAIIHTQPNLTDIEKF